MGVENINNGKMVQARTLTPEEQSELKASLSRAKNAQQKESIYNEFMRSKGIIAGEQKTQPTQEEIDKQVRQLIDEGKFTPKNLKLEGEWLEKYKAANGDVAKEKEVVLGYVKEHPEALQDILVEITTGKKVASNRSTARKDGGIELSNYVNEKLPLVDENGNLIAETMDIRAEALEKQYQNQIDNQVAKAIADFKPNKEQQAQLDTIKNNLKLDDNTKKKTIEGLMEKWAQEKADDMVIKQALNSELGNVVEAQLTTVKSRNTANNKMSYYDHVMTDKQRSNVEKNATDKLNKMYELLKKDPAQLTQAEKAQIAKLKEDFNKAGFTEGKAFGENQDLTKLMSKGNEMQQTEAYQKLKALATMEAISEELGITLDQGLSDTQLNALAKAEVAETITHRKALRDIENKIGSSKNEALCDEAEKLRNNRDNCIARIKEHMAHNQADAQTRQEAYKQKYEQTQVHAKDLNKLALKIIKKDKTFAASVTGDVCSKNDPEAVECPDGKFRKLDSQKYKKALLTMANERNDYGEESLESSYYCKTSEWVELAQKGAHKKSGVPTLQERQMAREMFDQAGIEAEKDRTLAKRAVGVADEALGGAITGLGAGIAGAAATIAKGLGGDIIPYIASKVITGTVSVNVPGETINGEVTTELTSNKYVYNQKYGTYDLVDSQTTPVTIPYSHTTDSKTLEQAYTQQVDIPGETQCPKVSQSFNYKDALKSSLSGLVTGAGIAGGLKLIGNWFKRKKDEDYDNTNSSKGAIRYDTGYTKDETIQATSQEAIAVVKADVEKEITTTQKEEVEIPTEKYKVKRHGGNTETIGTVVAARYGVKPGSAEYKAILRYIRELNGVPASGMKNGKVVIPPGDTWKLPEWIPANVFGEGGKQIDRINGKVGTVKYRNGGWSKAGAGKDAKDQKDVTTTATTKSTDTWDVKGKNAKKRPNK